MSNDSLTIWFTVLSIGFLICVLNIIMLQRYKEDKKPYIRTYGDSKRPTNYFYKPQIHTVLFNGVVYQVGKDNVKSIVMIPANNEVCVDIIDIYNRKITIHNPDNITFFV